MTQRRRQHYMHFVDFLDECKGLYILCNFIIFLLQMHY